METALIGKMAWQIVIAGAAGIIAYIVVGNLLLKNAGDHTRNALKRLSEGSGAMQDFGTTSILKQTRSVSSPVGQALLLIPGFRSTYELLLKSGNANSAGGVFSYVAVCLVFTGLMTYVGYKIMGKPLPAVLLVSVLVAYFLPRQFFLKGAIRKRNAKFINQFPDALDMIVRSVKSGYPLNTALKMLADNTEAPVSTEFKQLADEIAYGRTLNEALVRLSERVDEPDIHFFVVVLAVQQETGGNLAEVLNNLSNIIRKRRQLKLKIKALTSEGRATGWVLSGIPFVIIALLAYTSPDYLRPLVETDMGNRLLYICAGMMVSAWVIVDRLVNFDI